MTLYKTLQFALRKHYPSWLYPTLTFWSTTSGKLSASEDNHDQQVKVESEPSDALLIGSQKMSEDEKNPKYRLFLDLDINAVLLPSSSEGHHHLIVDANLTKEQHDKVLDVLSEVGIIQRGFALGGRDVSGASLRLPWVVKGEDKSLRETISDAQIPF